MIDIKNHKDVKADLLSFKGKMLLDNLTSDKAKEASMRDVAVTYGILQTHENTLRGLDAPVVNIALIQQEATKVDDDIINVKDDRKRIKEELKQAKGG